MKKFYQLVGIFLLLIYSLLNVPIAEAKENDVGETEVEIIETVRYFPRYPSPDNLIGDYVTCTQHWDENCKDSTLQISQEDAVRLMKIAQAEAGTEGVYGQYLVMRVIMNRVYSDVYPETVEEVITQKLWNIDHYSYQFESYQNGRYEVAEPTADSHLALALLESNKNPDLEIIAFENVSNGNVLTRWYDMKFTYLNHIFYKQKD